MFGLFRYSGVGAVVVLWSATLISMFRAELNLFGWQPLSQLGVEPASAGIFSNGLVVGALLLISFSLWLKHYYRVSRSFVIIFIAGQLLQIIATLVPYGGESKIIHTTAAFGLACSLPLLMWRFAVTLPAGRLRQTAKQLFYVEGLAFVIGIGAFVLVGKAAPLSQALPAVVFHLWIIFLSLPSREALMKLKN